MVKMSQFPFKNAMSSALQSPIEYQRKEGGITVSRPLSSGRPPSAPPTPNGHAPQPPRDSEQDDQVRLPWTSVLTFKGNLSPDDSF